MAVFVDAMKVRVAPFATTRGSAHVFAEGSWNHTKTGESYARNAELGLATYDMLKGPWLGLAKFAA